MGILLTYRFVYGHDHVTRLADNPTYVVVSSNKRMTPTRRCFDRFVFLVTARPRRSS